MAEPIPGVKCPTCNIRCFKNVHAWKKHKKKKHSRAAYTVPDACTVQRIGNQFIQVRPPFRRPIRRSEAVKPLHPGIPTSQSPAFKPICTLTAEELNEQQMLNQSGRRKEDVIKTQNEFMITQGPELIHGIPFISKLMFRC